jgi:hypothetical protein
MLNEELPFNFPQIKALIWFDGVSTDPNYPSVSWPLETSDSAIAAFRQGIASPMYPENAYATLDVSPIPPPEYLVPTAQAAQGQ